MLRTPVCSYRMLKGLWHQFAPVNLAVKPLAMLVVLINAAPVKPENLQNSAATVYLTPDYELLVALLQLDIQKLCLVFRSAHGLCRAKYGIRFVQWCKLPQTACLAQQQ